MVKLGSLIKGAGALIALAVIVLMGMAVIEGFSKEFRDLTGATNMTMTLGNVNDSTRIGTSEQYPYAQTVTQCENSTAGVLVPGNFTFEVADSRVEGGFLTVIDGTTGNTSEWSGQSVECLGTYLADSSLQGQADVFGTGLAIFAAFIGVMVLAVLGKLILGLFKPGKE